MTLEHPDVALVQPVPPPIRVTPENINQINKLFWQRECEARDRRMANPAIYASGMASLGSETERSVPVKYQMSLELAMKRGEEEETRFQAARETAERAALIAFSRKGGMSRKRDSLSYLIFRLVRVNCDITLQGLLHELKSPRWKCIIISIDGSSDVLNDARMIRYEDYGHRPKTASFTGLKDRLSRAKTKINSR